VHFVTVLGEIALKLDTRLIIVIFGEGGKCTHAVPPPSAPPMSL